MGDQADGAWGVCVVQCTVSAGKLSVRARKKASQSKTASLPCPKRYDRHPFLWDDCVACVTNGMIHIPRLGV